MGTIHCSSPGIKISLLLLLGAPSASEFQGRIPWWKAVPSSRGLSCRHSVSHRAHPRDWGQGGTHRAPIPGMMEPPCPNQALQEGSGASSFLSCEDGEVWLPHPWIPLPGWTRLGKTWDNPVNPSLPDPIPMDLSSQNREQGTERSILSSRLSEATLCRDPEMETGKAAFAHDQTHGNLQLLIPNKPRACSDGFAWNSLSVSLL